MKYIAPIGAADPNDPYVDGNPGTGTEGSAVPAAAIEHPMREIIHVIQQADLVENAEDLTQLYQAVIKLIDDAINDPGTIAFFAAETAPVGRLECDGSAISRETYSVLFSVIGTTFGAGDGVNTFNIPDLRGEFIRGWDNGRNIDIGRIFGSNQKGSLMVYDTGSIGMYGLGTSITDGPDSQFDVGADSYDTGDYPSSRQISLSASNSTALPGTAGNSGYSGVVRPRNIALLPCIKY